MDFPTPLWVTLLVAGLGVAGTLLAALLGQSSATRREAARAHEEIERARAEVEREGQRWQRQSERADRTRWLLEKRTVYSEFLIATTRWERYIGVKRDQRVDRNGGVVPIDAIEYEDAVDRAYANVQVLGDASTHDAAHAVYHDLVMTMVHLEATHFSVLRVDEGAQALRGHLADFLAAVRRDLDIDPATPLTA